MVQEYKPVVQSTTLFSLALGPDLPWEDELYPGNLSQTVNGILTQFSLLTPAFSLPSAPAVLTVYLQRPWNAPLSLIQKSMNPQLRYCV